VMKAKDLRLAQGYGNILNFSVGAFESIYRQNRMPDERGQYEADSMK
jgi:hypothetical protein